MGLDYVSISSRRLHRIAHSQDFLVNVRSCNKGLLKVWIINKSSRKTIHYNHLTPTFYIHSVWVGVLVNRWVTPYSFVGVLVHRCVVETGESGETEGNDYT